MPHRSGNFAVGSQSGGDELRDYDNDSDQGLCLSLAKAKQWDAVETFYELLARDRAAAERGAEFNPTDSETTLNVLMMACRDNRPGVVTTLLDLGVDVNQQTNDGMTALHYAVEACSGSTIEALLKKGARPAVRGGSNQQIPLHIACQRGSEPLTITRVLLKHMAQNSRLIADQNGYLPVTYAVEACNPSLTSLLLSACGKEQIKGWQEANTGNTLLHLATIRRSPGTARALVAIGRGDVNARNAKGETPLHLAAQKCDEVMVKCLRSLKANPDIIDENEQTPLHIACMAGCKRITVLMIDRMKADIQMRTFDGSTLMHLAAGGGHLKCVNALLKREVPLCMPNKAHILPLHVAAKNGHLEVVHQLLEKGASVDARTKERLTALHLAVLNNQPDIIHILMGFGANVDYKGGKNGETPLHIAAQVNAVECAKMLFRTGASPNLTTGDERQETALHRASRLGYKKMVRLLLEEGANAEAPCRTGETALHLAVRHCHFRIVEILLEHAHRKYRFNQDVKHFVNLVTNEGETSLHLAFDLNDRRVHRAFEDVDIVNILLENGADPALSTKLVSPLTFEFLLPELKKHSDE